MSNDIYNNNKNQQEEPQPSTVPKSNKKKIHANVGFIGLGAMGMPMALNVQKQLADGFSLRVYDVHEAAIQQIVSSNSSSSSNAAGVVVVGSPAEMGATCDVVISMVPNDAVLRHVVCHPQTGLLAASNHNNHHHETKQTFTGIHIGCSTVHPDTSRDMARLHNNNKSTYIGAPVFARADGVAHRAAHFVVGGPADAIEAVRPVLESMGTGIHVFGNNDNDAGAGNVVKLCGNFMIAAAIESCAEACSLAEGNGLDRVAVMDMLSSTLFDCLIYQGYGMRVAHRQHLPGQPLVGPGFRLDLGLKDVTLTKEVAANVQTPMPLASLLQDRLLASQAKGRAAMDWSALALLASEEAGQDVSPWLPGGEEAAALGDSIAPM